MPNLLMHCGGKHVFRHDISGAPTPARTRSWVPVPHHQLIDLAEKTIEEHGFRVTNQAHGLWGGESRYFGLLELANAQKADDYTLVLGLRNSHDKTFPALLALGNQVLVCDNLSFFGEVVLTRRYTRFIERDLPGIVAQAVGRLSEMRTQQLEQENAKLKKPLLNTGIFLLLPLDFLKIHQGRNERKLILPTESSYSPIQPLQLETTLPSLMYSVSSPELVPTRKLAPITHGSVMFE
jgi:hypothetical protein